jgi:spermidine/putrescine transport system permease protein
VGGKPQSSAGAGGPHSPASTVGGAIPSRAEAPAVLSTVVPRSFSLRRAGRLLSDLIARRRLARHLLLLPTGVWIAIFFLGPLVLLALYSFGQENLITLNVSLKWTLGNYRELGNPIYRSTLLRSLQLSAETTVACAILGFPLAYLISRCRGRLQWFLLGAVIVPFWTSFLVRTYSWVNILQTFGPLDTLARELGLTRSHINVLYTPTAVGIGIVYSYLPLMILPIYVALERVDDGLLEAAADLGAGGFRTFRRVVLPLATPGLIAGMIIVGVPAAGEFVIPEILGGGKTLMIGNIVANQFLELSNYPFGAALAMSLMVVLMIAVFSLRRIQSRVQI